MSPHIVFLGDLAQRVIRTPTPHAFTLLSVHEHYHLPTLPPRYIDSYFVDPMGNGIPRERIFEVWKNKGTIRRGGKVVTKAQAQSEYMGALRAQAFAIASIASKLRQDFKANLKGSVRQLKASGFRGATGVAFDSKVWIQWADVEVATAKAERQVEFTLTAVGSILTIIGYSINGKIVVLDRVRENLRKFKRMPMKELIDLSVNETLSRTIITGVTGLMALGVMAYYGGEALFAFAVSMFFGIVVGTYSSIYIAAPMLTVLGVGRRDNFQTAADKKKKRRDDEVYSSP